MRVRLVPTSGEIEKQALQHTGRLKSMHVCQLQSHFYQLTLTGFRLHDLDVPETYVPGAKLPRLPRGALVVLLLEGLAALGLLLRSHLTFTHLP